MTEKEKTTQEILEESMPDFPEDRREMPDEDEFQMTTDEMEEVHKSFDGLVNTLYDRGYSPSELGIVVNSLGHRMNAARYDPHEYDRIALNLKIYETINEWKEEQDKEVPPLEIATVVEELGRHYRHMARREVYKDE